MELRRLGNSGTIVTAWCLGTMTFGGAESGIWSHIGQLQQSDVDGLMRRALKVSVTKPQPLPRAKAVRVEVWRHP